MSTAVDDLGEVTLFEGCSPSELAAIGSTRLATRSVAEGTVLCTQGDEASRWWLVRDGTVDVTANGRYVATIGAGESAGELALLDGCPRNATLTAATDAVVEEFDGASFQAVIVAHPALALNLLRALAVRLRRSTDEALLGLRVPVASAVTTSDRTPAATGAADGPPVFNPSEPGYFANPYAQYARLRAHDPVHLAPATGAYLITRYDDCHRFARDRTLMMSIERATSTPAVEAEKAMLAAAKRAPTMLRVDGDNHQRLRSLVSKVFTPKAIGTWRERADQIVDGVLGAAGQRDEIDVIADFALQLPAQVISEMLGMPQVDIPQLRTWSTAATKALDPIITPEERAAAVAAGDALDDYIEQVVLDKRAHPADDILTGLIHAEVDGERLTMAELISQVFILYIAGHETTLNLIGNGLTHLFEQPDQLDRLRTDPTLDANAIEELLRFDSPAQFVRRIAVDDLELRGVNIPAGSIVLLGNAAANRDPEKWGPTADRIDIARVGANQHLSFGGGAHHCLGAALARMEAQIALPRLLRHFPRMAAAYDTPAWATRIVLRGVERLPVTLR